MRTLTFYHVSGRGWVTQDDRCKECGQRVLVGPIRERPATDAEIAGIIIPALEKDPDSTKIEVPWDEVFNNILYARRR